MQSDRRLGSFEAATVRPMAAVSLAVIPVYVGQILAGDGSSFVAGSLRGARLLIHVAMAVDVGIRLYLAPDRLRFIAHNKLDLLAIPVPPLRALRTLVVFRAIVLRPGFVRFGAFSAPVSSGAALIVYGSEHSRADADIQSLGDAFWWAAVTATTVGYGDEVPVTTQGQAAALVLMLLGIATFSVLTAHVAAYFVGDDRPDAPAADMAHRLAKIEAALGSIQERLDIPVPADAGREDDTIENEAQRAAQQRRL